MCLSGRGLRLRGQSLRLHFCRETISSADRVLVIAPHPDDAEISSGGALARWGSEGREVHLLILTNGDRGSEDPKQDRDELAATRRTESEAAGRVLGLASVLPVSLAVADNVVPRPHRGTGPSVSCPHCGAPFYPVPGPKPDPGLWPFL